MKDSLRDDAGYLLRRAASAATADYARRLFRLGLRPSEATFLNVVATNRGITQSRVGRHLGIVSANMAPLVARLEGRRLIERVRLDARSQGLSLTKAGQVLERQARKEAAEHVAALLHNIPKAEQKAFMSILRQLF